MVTRSCSISTTGCTCCCIVDSYKSRSIDTSIVCLSNRTYCIPESICRKSATATHNSTSRLTNRIHSRRFWHGNTKTLFYIYIVTLSCTRNTSCFRVSSTDRSSSSCICPVTSLPVIVNFICCKSSCILSFSYSCFIDESMVGTRECCIYNIESITISLITEDRIIISITSKSIETCKRIGWCFKRCCKVISFLSLETSYISIRIHMSFLTFPWIGSSCIHRINRKNTISEIVLQFFLKTCWSESIFSTCLRNEEGFKKRSSRREYTLTHVFEILSIEVVSMRIFSIGIHSIGIVSDRFFVSF